MIIKLNESVIPHYRVSSIHIDDLKKLVALNEKYLKEKPTWYVIDRDLCYFKSRNDTRLFSELFFSMFGKEIMGLNTLEYNLAYVRATFPTIKSSDEITKPGLISKNFQMDDYNYYLVSELLNSDISTLSQYGKYNLESLLLYFKNVLTSKDYEVNEDFLIRLFVADSFTGQQDRNPNNIGFEIPKIDGVPYNKRLIPATLLKNDKAEGRYEIDADGIVRLKELRPSVVFDSERILGIDHKNELKHTMGDVWCPLFSYNDNTLFATQEDAKRVQDSDYSGLDPNLCELYMNYSDVCEPIFDRLANDDEYRRILERFKSQELGISLDDSFYEYVNSFFEERQKVMKKVWHMMK